MSRGVVNLFLKRIICEQFQENKHVAFKCEKKISKFYLGLDYSLNQMLNANSCFDWSMCHY